MKRLLEKYGEVWEPWRTERAKFANVGKEFETAS